MADQKVKVNFVQICGDIDRLFGLDVDGRVWRYVPKDKGNHYSFWVQLTQHGSKHDDSESLMRQAHYHSGKHDQEM